MKTWTDEEVDILKENYNKVSNVELNELIPQKSEKAIYKKAYSLGLRKTQDSEFKNRSIAHRGENSYRWNGGSARTSKGYKLVKIPEHHRSDNKGYVLEHILIFERETGIIVPNNCCIHHLNGIKDDNRIENLCIMTHSAHTAFHNITPKRKKLERNKYE